MSDDYVTLAIEIRFHNKDAALIALSEDPFTERWIPYSLMHGADESKLRLLRVGETMQLRIFHWKAKQEGLLEGGKHQAELFG